MAMILQSRLLQEKPEAVNYYNKALHLGCCSSPRSASENLTFFLKICKNTIFEPFFAFLLKIGRMRIF